MNRIALCFPLLVSFVFSTAALAEEPVGPAKETIELPDIEVLGTRQELALRIIRSGLEGTRSDRHEDRNKPYCWFDSPAGTHMKHLYCGLNRSLSAETRYWQALFTPDGLRTGVPMAAGTSRERKHIFRSRSPVSPREVERMVGMLGGPTELNDEIVTRAIAGEPMPKDVPSETEIERFAEALREVREIRQQSAVAADAGEDSEMMIEAELERRMIETIENAGLTVSRYNAISELVERYSSLRAMVKEKM